MSSAPKAPERAPAGEPALIRRARAHCNRIAIISPEGVFTYRDLLTASAAAAERLLSMLSQPISSESAGLADSVGASGRAADLAGAAPDLDGSRVTYLVPPGFDHVAVQWGIWRAGGVAVPLAVSHPPPELAYVLDDAEPTAVVVHPSLADRIIPLARERELPALDSEELCAAVAREEPVRTAEPSGPWPAAHPHHPDHPDHPALPSLDEDRRALMIYTSGTTGRAKGVVTTHANVEAQVTSLVTAWEWSPEDHTLLVLPLHHVHGIINVVACALWTGACCQMLASFDAPDTWERFARGDITLFMAVPTVYVQLIRAWERATREDRERWSEGARTMRLMVSGSAALPVGVLARWRDITGHVLLERYGMTEIGMALSNPLRGERRPGHVGHPLPGVEIRRVDEAGLLLTDPADPGELEVKGPGVFSEYWRQPKETVGAFRDGWFRTGDVAIVEEGHYRLLGRTSVDIVKIGGYKVSALEVEGILGEHEHVEDCAVVGVPDPEWGERLCVAFSCRDDGSLDAEALRAWAGDRLAPYKVPREYRVVESLPRNAMGKVQKQTVKTLFETGGPT